MINLFDRFDEKVITLYKSFKYSGMKVSTIVIEETGFLPQDVITPYQFFANNKKIEIQPLYFNQLKVPKYWMIEGNNDFAVVKNKNELKARIFYKKNFRNRIIERVEWLNGSGKTQFIDYYNQYGFKYAKLVLNSDSQRGIMKFYYNDQGETIILEHLITNDVLLYWHQQTYQFHSIIHFMEFFLKVGKFNTDSFLYQSLVKPAAIVSQIKTSGKDYLYWQEDINDNTVQHMIQAFKNPYRDLRIITKNHSDYMKLIKKIDDKYHTQIFQGGYVYRKIKENRYSNQVLCLTNSDQLINLNDIINTCTHLEFHIAALTTMSEDLLSYNQYDNVNLYPNVTKQQCIELYKTCDIYLDINKGNEILDAVRVAFDYNLLILAYDTVAHNLDVTAPENVFSTNDEITLIKTLNDSFTNQAQFNQRLHYQIAQAGGITPMNFKEIFK